MGVTMDSDRVVKVSELRGDTTRWLAKAEEGPVFILRYGCPKAVLIGTKAFEELLDRVALRAELTRREKESVEKISQKPRRGSGRGGPKRDEGG